MLDVGGVGYDIAIPLGTEFGKIDPGPGGEERVRVWTHLIVREDAHKLFGFSGPGMREVFRLLLKVRGVGPGLAQGILSSLPAPALLEAVASADAEILTRIKGVGKKTAEQILLDLRDRAPKPTGDDDYEILVPHGTRTSETVEDAVRALTSIGYSDKEARKTVERAAKEVPTDDLELLVRAALQR